MTPTEFVEFYRSNRNRLSNSLLTGSTTVDPVITVYKDINAKIQPHFTGEIPQALLNAFPNEDPEILKYRCKIFEPVTLPIVMQAVDDVSSCFFSSKFSKEFENVRMEEYINTQKFSGLDFFAYMFRVWYARRASNPNGWLLWKVKNSDGQTDDRFNVDVEPVNINENQIVYESINQDVLIYAPKIPKDDKDIKGNKTFEKLRGLSEKIKWHIVTTDFFGRIERNENGNESFIVEYRHQMGKMPAFKNGGRPIYVNCDGVERLVYHSDFASAIPHLNRFIVAENQEVSIALSSGFPHKFLRGITCTTCNGMKKVVSPILDPKNPDGVTDCKSCNGQGRTFSSSPLNGYYLTGAPEGATEEERRDYINTPPIQFEQPDVGILNYVGERKKAAEMAAKESLNIRQHKTFQETAEAKRIDKESLGAQVGRITADVFDIIRMSLKCIQQMRLQSTAPISIITPTSFDFKTENDLFQEYKSCSSDTPIGLRGAVYKDLICKRFAGDEKFIRMSEIAATYAPAYLMTETEIETCMMTGVINREQAIKAKFVSQMLERVDSALIMSNDENAFDVISNRLDQLFIPLLPTPIVTPEFVPANG